MWYTVATQPMVMQNGVIVREGSVWTAKPLDVGGCAMVEFTNVDEMAEVGTMYIAKASARTFFTKPTKDLNSAMETSFGIAEAV